MIKVPKVSRKKGLLLLQKLAEKLRKIPLAKFNMYIWDCGTTSCALGWAQRLVPESLLVNEIFEPSGIPNGVIKYLPDIDAQYISNIEAAMKAFALNKKEA